jgi:hypothetical protein
MKVSKEIIEVLDYIGEKIGVTIDWTSDNVIPYVKELCEKFVSWEIGTSYAWIAIAGFMFVLALVFTIIINRCSDWDGVEWLIFGVISIAAIIIIGTQVFDIIECKTFPEKAIYEYIYYNTNILD